MDALKLFLKEYAAYGYPVLFFGVLAENAGIPVPGETAVLVAGFLASSAGGGHFQLLLVILITFVVPSGLALTSASSAASESVE